MVRDSTGYVRALTMSGHFPFRSEIVGTGLHGNPRIALDHHILPSGRMEGAYLKLDFWPPKDFIDLFIALDLSLITLIGALYILESFVGLFR